MTDFFPLQAPKDKHFSANIRASGEPLDYEQWLKCIIKAIDGFHFGPDVGPLRIVGSQEDQMNLEKIAVELKKIKWFVTTDIHNKNIWLIYHPKDPCLVAL